MNNNLSEGEIRTILRELSPTELLRMGMHEIAYVRPVALGSEGKMVFCVHAADGSQLSVLDTMEMALSTLFHNDLLPVTLH
jgi:hypothetical protein